MVFSSIEFILFFVVVVLLLLLLKTNLLSKRFGEDTLRKFRHFLLLISSYIFYGWWNWKFCFLMLFMTFVAYICARQIENGSRPKAFKLIGIIIPLIVLGVFKYFNFFIESFCFLFEIESARTLNIILPVGISFYTFQSMSYTIDVVRGTLKSQSFLDVALYISFFPQLVAGPIVKASDFIPQLKENRDIGKKAFCEGLQIFLFGLFKKVVVSDNLSVFVDDVFARPEIFSSYSIILGIISYSIQIYFDFSGYSDMAVGLAKCLGYDFKRNFNLPYISKNVSEFWKRWHISLSEWLQEYLYIPLGGNRKGTIRTYLNLMITMILGGLWHGANITFIIWGFLHGIALCVHKAFKKHFHTTNVHNALFSGIRVIVTYIYVCLCWVFFRATDLSSALFILKKVFIWEEGVIQTFSWTIFAIVLLAICELVAIIRSKKLKENNVTGFYYIANLNSFWGLTLFWVFLGLTIGLAYTDSNPFIYFQF